MAIEKYLEHLPKINPKSYIADSAVIMGMVELDEGTSVWPNATMRGDVNYIKMGKFSNVQDNAVVHVAAQPCPTIIGDHVTIGHGAIVHGCCVGRRHYWARFHCGRRCSGGAWKNYSAIFQGYGYPWQSCGNYD